MDSVLHYRFVSFIFSYIISYLLHIYPTFLFLRSFFCYCFCVLCTFIPPIFHLVVRFLALIIAWSVFASSSFSVNNLE